MKARKLVLVMALVGALLLGLASSGAAITNGKPDGNAHPYVGLLVFDVAGPGGTTVPAWRCSGALIAPNVVLTAGHCTEGAVAARVWFDEVVQGNPDYPRGGPSAVEGTPYTHPDFCHNCYGPSNGLPAFSYRDVGVVVLSRPVSKPLAAMPSAGLVDRLANKTAVTLVGYGVQEKVHVPGGGAPVWAGLRNRLMAPSELVSGQFVHSNEYMRIALNPGGGSGGTCFGDSGGPDLLGNTHTVLAVNSYVTNSNCSGVGYSARVDIPAVLRWIRSFLD